MRFNEALSDWYRVEKRALPWRETEDPYKIWISEVVLQQTRVEQGLGHYRRFIEWFPDIRSLATAREQKVLKAWEGLGYYSRARNLHAAAKQIMSEFGGVFPERYEDVISLKGVGPYTAAAILSIAFAQPYPVIDGNVARVVSRLTALTEAVDQTAGKKAIAVFIQKHIDKKDPGTFNQAMMELGALICKPARPECTICPVASYCQALKLGVMNELPVKTSKTKTRIRHFNYLVILEKSEGHTYIKKRTESDIWKNLYDFPLIETVSEMSPASIIATKEWKFLFKGADARLIESGKMLLHKLSHQELHVKFHVVMVKNRLTVKEDLVRASTHQLAKYPFPVLIANYLRSFPAVSP
jgi:A/G-specific adenine glycosylase